MTYQFSLEHLKKVRFGLELFNQGKYWECHEELEDHWLEDRGDDCRYVYWVIIQVATALLHFSDNNLAGAQGMINKSREKLIECEKRNVESILMYKFLGWKRLKYLIRKIPINPELKDFTELSQFKFSDPSKWDVHLKKMEGG